jgi:hypothetical protein
MTEQTATLNEILEGTDVISRVASDVGMLIRLSDEIHDLDPLLDAERLVDLHRYIRLEIGLSDQIAVRSIGLLLLDLVAARQSPTGTKMLSLLQTEQERFTPALIRALWETRELSRSEMELRERIDDAATLAFMTRDLVHAGMLARAGEEELAFRLTPAGRHAMGPISRKVLALELGRFPWPENVPAATDWAREEGLELYRFSHGGEDGVAVAQCIGERTIGSLSMPSLYGVARPEPAKALALSDPFQALAVLPGPTAHWDDGAVDTRVDRILADRRTLASRTTVRDVKKDVNWDLTLFAGDDFRELYGGRVTAACDQAEVACTFAG